MIGMYFSSAVRGLISAKTRAFLALLGIMMGIFLIVILLGIGVGVEKHIVDRLTNLGPEVLVVTSRDDGETGADDVSLFSTVDTLTSRSFGLDDVKAIEELENVKAVAPVQYFPGSVEYGSKRTLGGSVIASTTAEYDLVRKNSMQSGRFFTQEDQRSGNIKAVIGAEVKERLFGNNDALGKVITFEDKELEVVGVFADSQTSNESLSANNNGAVYASASLQTNPKLASTYTLVMVRADGIKNVEQVKSSITSALAAYRKDSTFKVVASDDLIKQSANMLDVLSALIVVLAIISLFMSGIGIMNMMVVSVTDRTKEIGVRKTVGATSANIFWQFLIEAVLLTFAGGVLGVALSFATAFVMGRVLPFEPVMSSNLIFIGIALSVLVGVLFGVGPAINAARKEPIEALHTDHT